MKYFLGLITILLSFNSFSQTTPLCFSEPKYRSVGIDPEFVSSGDFNNDGFPDIVVTNRWFIDSITVLINSGDGINFSRFNYQVGWVPEDIIAADFNSDSNLDLAIASNNAPGNISQISILMGSNTGTFSAAINYTVIGNGEAIDAQDFNNDGNLDLIVGTSLNISYLYGNGTGGFSQPAIWPGAAHPYDFIAKDLNLDGAIDLFWIDFSSGNDFLNGYLTGVGLFVPIQTLTTCIEMVSDDYDNNGYPDIAICAVDQIIIMYNLGNSPSYSMVTYTVQNTQEQIGMVSVDMNNDSNKDLVVVDDGSEQIHILYGSSNGVFTPDTVGFHTGSGSMSWGIASADFNSDGKPDLVTVNPGLNNVSILLNRVKPNVTISASTNSLCIGSGVTLQANGAYSYSWNTGDTTAINYQMPLTDMNYIVTGTGINYCVNTQSTNVIVNNTCQDIWPGDANSDGRADNVDVLELGLHYTQTGTPRTSVSNTWQSYFANNWAGTITNGKNLNHSDCNGDGTINDDDTLAIFNNYGLTHAFKPTQTNTVNPQLNIVPDQAYVTKGNWGTASIYLGDATNPITNINGLAFTVDFDNTLIETNSIYIEYQNSFLDVGQNLHFRKVDFSNGKIFTATTHTLNNNVSGNGLIGKLHYQIKSSLTADQVLNLGISQANQSDASGIIGPLTSGTGTLMAIGASVGIQELNGNVISISPNPTNGSLTINSKTELQKIEVVAITGQVLLSEVPTNVLHTLHLDNFANGIYFVNLYQNNRIVKREKVVLNK